MSKTLGVFSAALALLATNTADGASALSCPKTLQVSESIGAVPQGFKAFANGNTPSADLALPIERDLNNIQFSDGPPNEIAWLAPDNEERRFQTWHFAPGNKVWFTCGYSDTRLILSAPLPPGITSCRIDRDPAARDYDMTGITCK